MCTAITLKTKDHYFGRNLDLERSYGECVVISPRNYPFSFRCGEIIHEHYAMIGMAAVRENFPLYFEATNEKGLSMAGLNFPGNAVYFQEKAGMYNLASFELIPRLLCQFDSIASAMPYLKKLNLTDVPFSEELYPSPLHWLLADEKSCLTIEQTKNGLSLHENPIGILTNNPPFDYHIQNLANYMNLTAEPATNRFCKGLDLKAYSLGMGAMGLPGDPSSPSRFIRAAFTKFNSVCGDSEAESISQFFHILGSVAQQRGVTCLDKEVYEYTRYSSCCNTNKGIYYYTTYENNQITAVDMHKADLSGTTPVLYPLIIKQQIRQGN